ncbi:MAG: hypothetical protein QOH25_1801 [Acidobacteriota bacterium]|jgi:uncharacterized protein (DUF1778 family)|nr:hypothetical protein [Acidobacteriota bacterium]
MTKANFKKITVRANKEKYDEISEAARNRKFKSRSKYLIWAHGQCEGKDAVPAPKERSHDDEIFLAMNRIGHNLNQLTARINVFAKRGYVVAHHAYTELIETLDEHELVLRELKKKL